MWSLGQEHKAQEAAGTQFKTEEYTGKSQMFCFHWTRLSSEPSVIFTLPKAGFVREEILQLHQNCENDPKLPNISYLVISIERQKKVLGLCLENLIF